jgi:hypothetical protein
MPVPGGFPSNPRFRSVTIALSTAAPAAPGELVISGTSPTRGLKLNNNFGGGSEIHSFGGVPFIDLTMDGSPVIELNTNAPSLFTPVVRLKVQYWDIPTPGATLHNATLGNAHILRIAAAPTTMTGIAVVDAGTSATFSGKPIFLLNASVNALTIAHNDVGSSTNNRIMCPGSVNFVIPGHGGAVLVYDAITLRWRVVAKA